MKMKPIFIALPLIMVAGCRSSEQPNNTMNVEENLTTTDMNAIVLNDMDMNNVDMNATDANGTSYSGTATSMNASGSDADVLAPPPPIKKGHGK